MRKRLFCAALILSLLTSCAPSAEAPAAETGTEPQPPAADMPTGMEWADYYARVILFSQPDGEEYTALSAEDGEFYLTLYGLSLPEQEDGGFGYAVYTVGGVDAREIAVVCGSGAGSAGMEDYRQSRVGNFTGYAPAEAALVEKGVVLQGNMNVLAICTDPDAAREALEKAAPSLVLEPYDPAGEEAAYDWTDDVSEKGWQLFDPPNKFDMTPYDASDIRRAWETGDEGGLNEKDAAILAKCREALEAAVKPGMTEFQKELNLHDWLVQSYYGCYDRTVHDPKTPMGREDNLNPYGLLVRGYGICLSYATTFQLLMDLAGVECITVVGASSGSGSDHAWNMVKLEGEWYCVDPTWNATYKEDLTGEAMRTWQHRYFNVTSDRMRETDHQWDYGNVPETAATRFRWDGTGELPQ